MFKFVIVQLAANRSHAAVHHVRWRDDVCSSPCMSQGLLCQEFERGVIDYLLVFNHPAMSMISVFTETDISDHKQFQFGLTNGFDGLWYNTIGRE